MTAVTFKRIDQLYGDLTKIVNDPTALSDLPAAEQNRRVAKGCVQVCELLKDWLAGDVWNGMRASAGGPATHFAEDQEQLDPMLQTLPDFLKQASGRMMDVRPELVDQAREALKAAAVRDQELFKNAESRVDALRNEFCKLADKLYDQKVEDDEKTKVRVRARRWLTAVTALLPALVIAMASVPPSQVAVNVEQWTRDVRTAVGIVVDIATTVETLSRRADGVPAPTVSDGPGDRQEPERHGELRGVPGQRDGSRFTPGSGRNSVGPNPRVQRKSPKRGKPGSHGVPER